MITFVFVMFLIFIPMYAFVLFRRVFRIFRFVPYLMREVIIPQIKMATETEEEGEGGEGGEKENKIKLSSAQIKIIEDSVLTSSVEINPKRFSKRTKKRLSVAFAAIGLVILALVVYKLFWFVYDFIVLTFF